MHGANLESSLVKIAQVLIYHCQKIIYKDIHRFPLNWGRTECVGVDADRNWDYHWGEKDSSRDPCADNYAGPHPFSEPETRAVSEFLAEHRDLIKVR